MRKRQESLKNDKRFKKSDQPGMLYVASNYGQIPDETLIAYGFQPKQWKREKQGIDNIVYIYDMSNAAVSSTMQNQF